MIRLTNDSKEPGIGDVIAIRCHEHRNVPAWLARSKDGECGECKAVAMTFEYGVQLEDEKLDILDAYAAALSTGAQRQMALYMMSRKTYELLDRLRLIDPHVAADALVDFQRSGLPPRDLVDVAIATYYTPDSQGE